MEDGAFNQTMMSAPDFEKWVDAANKDALRPDERGKLPRRWKIIERIRRRPIGVPDPVSTTHWLQG